MGTPQIMAPAAHQSWSKQGQPKGLCVPHRSPFCCTRLPPTHPSAQT